MQNQIVLLQLKKQLEETIKTQQLLKKLPTKKLVQFNSVMYLEAKLPKQDKCIISLEADYAAEVSLDSAQQILQRRRIRLEENFNNLREKESYEEMQHDIGNKIDEDKDQSKKRVKKLILFKNQREEEKLQLKQKQEKERLEKERLEREKIEKEKQKQNQSMGQVTQLADGLVEIEEKYVQEDDCNEAQINEEKQQLLKLISDAFYKEKYDDYDRYQLQLKELNEKLSSIKPKTEIPQQKEAVQAKQQLPTIQENEPNDDTQQEEQPKRISKFKQDRLKQKKG
ncbi:unnamed protein product (macronuclear) [Paramecium tetraurelia]|uniref:Uncharacterized protein n=1 Tax=Paramecium tetraurelia TaxID=5888 RepID=A0C126_PARTE|nr:uncharacterized protein GSPATT00033969001 [Paramecium tetraurelia]CAK64493.1 unnamed protein product [Paramecium tetraurelia]|eukprot:XP_001431891.1 hypothetical protein (macronuclear) [Paramecium tetraurelia strain d4-2]